jgi:AraC family transcriptional regulator
MDVQIVIFPETKVAALEHFGSSGLEDDAPHKLIAWKLERHLLDALKNRSYVVHYTDPHNTCPSGHHVDFCLSVDQDVAPNSYGIINKIIPSNRCAFARDIGHR